MHYQVVVVNEKDEPLRDVTVEAVDVGSWPSVSATAVTGNNGMAEFSGVTGPQFFRARIHRHSGARGKRTYVGAVKVQVVSLGESMNVDYVVDPDGAGTHTTITDAMAAAITAQTNKTIWICKSPAAEDAVEVGGMAASQHITIASHSKHTVVLTAKTNDDIFKQTSNGGQTGSLNFRNVGFSVQSANYAVLEISTGTELGEVTFEECEMSGEYLLRQDGNDSMGNVKMEVRDCTGTFAGFYQVAGASATYSPDQLKVHGCMMTLDEWWDGGSTDAAPDRIDIKGGYYGILGALNIGATTECHFSSLYIVSSIAGALFTTDATSSQIEDVSFTDIVVRFTSASGTFCNLGSANTNNNSGLFIDGVFGYPASGVGAGGTFVTVDTDWIDVHVGDIFGKDFTTQYSGPASGGYGGDHGALGGLSDDDHTQYTLKSTLTAEGSMYLASGASTPAELAISAPAVDVRNVLGVDNGESTAAWKTALDGTNPADIAAAASPGTSLVFSHRDHVHNHPDIAADLHTVYLLANSGRAWTGTMVGASLDLSGSMNVAGDVTWDGDGGVAAPAALTAEVKLDISGTTPNRSVNFYYDMAHEGGAGTAAFRYGRLTNSASLTSYWFKGDASATIGMQLTHGSGQLSLPVAGSSAGLSIGGDVLLYRSAANVLALNNGDWLSMNNGGLVVGVDGEAGIILDGTNWTPVDVMGIGESNGSLYLQGRNGMYFVVDPAAGGARNFYWYANDDLAAGTKLAQLDEGGQFELPITGSGAGIQIGGDVQLYRSAADVLYIPDSVEITTQLRVDSVIEHTAANGVTIDGVLLKDDYISFDAVSSDPAYVDGQAILYFFSDGAGDDQFKVRGKIGATETEVSLADITP